MNSESLCRRLDEPPSGACRAASVSWPVLALAGIFFTHALCARVTLAQGRPPSLPVGAVPPAGIRDTSALPAGATPRQMAPPRAAEGAAALGADTVRFRLLDVELRAAVQVLGQYLDRPIVSSGITGSRVTLQTPAPVRRSDVPDLLRAMLENQGLELVADSAGPYTIRQRAGAAATSPREMVSGPGGAQLFVIRLNHARAADVAATVNALYGRATGFGDQSAPAAAGTLPQELQQNQQATLAPPPGIPGGVTVSPFPLRGGNMGPAGETTIVPDAGTNSLMIRAAPQAYALIEAAVKQLDVRPLQVLIEVLVAEVSRNRALSFGVDVSLPAARAPGLPNTTIAGSQTGLAGNLGDLVLRVMGIAGDRDAAATLRAAATRGDITIVSRPTVVAANNQQAQILVGSQRPFVQVSRSLPTQVATRDQVVQYKDVGTKLTVRPTISTDGYVMLQVTQEVNAVTGEFSFDAPVISTRTVQTQLLLKDGQTVVIGGLTDRQRSAIQQGIPILSSIPIIGGLFGRVSRQTTETELFLFITPRVIRTDADADSLTTQREKRANKNMH